MENESSQSASKVKSNIMPIAIVIAIVVIILVGAVALGMNKKSEESQESKAGETQENSQTQMKRQPAKDSAMMKQSYKDGNYSSEGAYTSPGGAESISVKLTLKNNVVENATVASIKPSGPIATKMQAAFISGFKDQVIGKNINGINVTKVAGSSLTPQGFNDAVEKIKSKAKA